MYILAIDHAVTDYEKWKTVYDSFPPTTGGPDRYWSVLSAFVTVNMPNTGEGDPTLGSTTNSRTSDSGLTGLGAWGGSPGEDEV